jgi:hypothetical protein
LGDVVLLSFLAAPADQDNQLETILGEINAQSWSPIDFVFTYTAKPLDAGEIALFHAKQGHADLGCCHCIKCAKLLGKGAIAIGL